MENGAGKVCGCVSKSVGYNWFNFLCSSASVFAVIGEDGWLPPATLSVKCADTVTHQAVSRIQCCAFRLRPEILSWRTMQDTASGSI